jgi:hypothetical protein
MKKGFLPLLIAASLYAQEAEVVQKPMAIGAFHEFGAVYNGLYSTGESPRIIGTEWIDHFGAFLGKEAVVNGRLHLSAGIGGVFQFRKPETVGSGFDFSQRKAFFIGPTPTMATFHFGDMEMPWLKLGTGLFSYKYNPDATNLGEYLFRSRAYPTALNTGGYVFANSASANLQGVKAEYQNGNLKADLLFTSETELAPLYDWSLALVGSYSIGSGLLELGAGVNLSHVLPVKPSRTTSTERENGYFKAVDPMTGVAKDYSGNPEYYANAAAFHYGKATAADSLKAAVYERDQILVDSLLSLPKGGGYPSMSYYTTQSIILMARATLDPKKLFDAPVLGEQDLKLYFEADVLGVKNYPVFYTDVMKRIPIMAGFNIPTFRLLDLFAVQVERFNSPWLNNTYSIASGSGEGEQRKVLNTPFLPNSGDVVLSRNNYNDGSNRDNWKWSLLAKKTIQGRLTFSAQVARDHLRIPSSQFYYGPQYEPNEVTAFEDSWYWVTQISWGL